MGIFKTDGIAEGHEGYAIGYVPRDHKRAADGLWRELQYGPADDRDIPHVRRIAAGCDCGWRSPAWEPLDRAEWSPYTVHLGRRDDELVRELWDEHAEHMERLAQRSRAAHP